MESTSVLVSHQLLDYYKQAAMILGGAVAAPVTLALIGFTPAGVAAGEYLICSSLHYSHRL